MAAALLRRLHDDVAALEMDGLAAPGGGHEQLRPLVDINGRSVGKTQHRMSARPGADQFLVGDGGLGVEHSAGQAVERAGRGHDRRARTTRSHPGINGVASDIQDREDQRGCGGQRSPPAPARRGSLRHGDHSPLAFHLGQRDATRGAAADVVFEENRPATREGSAHVGAEVWLDLRTAGRDANAGRHLLPNAGACGLERPGIDGLLLHLF